MASGYPSAIDTFDVDHTDNPTALIRPDMDNALDAINKIEAELGVNPRGASATVRARLDTLAPLASPTFTGTPTAPTASLGTNTTQIATMAALQAAGAVLLDKAMINAKGDLIVGTANDTATRLAVGSDAQVLTADATQGTGVRWATPSGGGGGIGPMTFTVASNDAPATIKSRADYLCDGTADEVQINAAIAAVGTKGGVVQLSQGEFVIAAPIAIDHDSVTLRGSGAGEPASSSNAATAVATRIRVVSGFTGTEGIRIVHASAARPLANARVEHLTIDGANIGSAVDGILYRSYNGGMLNVRVYRFTGNGIHCKGYLNGQEGASVDWDLYDSFFSQVMCYGCTLDGVFLENGSTDMMFSQLICAHNDRANFHMKACASNQVTQFHFYSGGLYNCWLQSAGARSKFSNGKMETSGQHNCVLDSSNSVGMSDVQFSNIGFFNGGGLAADATYSALWIGRFDGVGTARPDRNQVTGCTFGQYGSITNKYLNAIHFSLGGVTNWSISGCTFVGSSTTNANVNSFGSPGNLHVSANAGFITTNGGTSTTTPGAVTTVVIAHGCLMTPTVANITPANSNARGAPAFHVTFDATNITLNFASALTAATSYSWVWSAGRGEA